MAPEMNGTDLVLYSELLEHAHELASKDKTSV